MSITLFIFYYLLTKSLISGQENTFFIFSSSKLPFTLDVIIYTFALLLLAIVLQLLKLSSINISMFFSCTNLSLSDAFIISSSYSTWFSSSHFSVISFIDSNFL